MELSSKITAIVTGGSSGLGASISEKLSKSNVRVSIFDKNEEQGRFHAKKIKAKFFKVDITNPQSVLTAIKGSRKDFGFERICINCAGIAPAMKTVSKEKPHDIDLFKKVISVNLIGSFIVASQSAAGMSKLKPLNEDGERGVIINTSSVAAFDGQKGQIAYSASKGGIASMTLPMARDLAKNGIRVISIAPGIFETPMVSSMPKILKDNLVDNVPFPKRFGKPSEFSDLILHIIQNTMLNGETIRLDGSIRMPPN